MCLIFIAKNQHPELPFILAANRDEFYHRPALAAQPWDNYPHLIAGKDLSAGGSWLGITRQGTIAALTNIRQPNQTKTAAKSRGEIVKNYLVSDAPQAVVEDIKQHKNDFAGFNLIYGNVFDTFSHISQAHDQTTVLDDGIHGLSNADLNAPWPKVAAGKQSIAKLCQQDFHAEQWFQTLANPTTYPENLPNTGVSDTKEAALSAAFINLENYGTRASTLITVDRKGHIQFIERSFDEHGQAIKTLCYQWQANV